jgi:hypothetical protein
VLSKGVVIAGGMPALNGEDERTGAGSTPLDESFMAFSAAVGRTRLRTAESAAA